LTDLLIDKIAIKQYVVLAAVGS